MQQIVIGVLALQGAFIEHINHINAVSAEYPDHEIQAIEVRTTQQLDSCDGLIIPGGESTTIALIATRTNMLAPLQEFVKTKPVWGTCAGLIFLSKQVVNGVLNQQLLGALNIEVVRNAFGRQIDSFVADLEYPAVFGGDKFQSVFIRAPVINRVLAQDHDFNHREAEIIYSENNYANPAPVEVLKQLDDGAIVAVRQGDKLGTSFHPELSNDSRFHKYFIDEFVLANR